MPLLEIKDLSVRYDKAQILNGVSLTVNQGEFVGLVGPNGAGKSTLLRAISGLVRFEERLKRGTAGDIVLEGEVRFAGEPILGLPPHEIAARHTAKFPGSTAQNEMFAELKYSRPKDLAAPWGIALAPARQSAPILSVPCVAPCRFLSFFCPSPVSSPANTTSRRRHSCSG